MSRTKAREIALHLIFEAGFHGFDNDDQLMERLDAQLRASLAGEVELYAGKLSEKQTEYILNVVKGVASHTEELDAEIVKHSKGWSIGRITRITRAILRLALYEIGHVEDVPTGAAINEAVELAKLYDSEEAGRFVNGILGSVVRAGARDE